MELFTRIGAAILLIVGGGLWLFAPTTERVTAHSEVVPHLPNESSHNQSVPNVDLLATHGLDGIVAYAETQTQLPKPTPAKGPSCEVLKPDQGFVDEMLVRFAEDGSKSYERRVALVIGNGSYQGAIGRLDNPANDATSMANVMSALGFTVYRGIDLDADGLEKCLSRFTTELQSKPTDIALFFYAGHGIQLVSEKDNEKRNYMMATDARIAKSGEGVGYKQIDAVLNQMRDHSEQSVFFYDACRNYPLGDQKPEIIDGVAIKRGIGLLSGAAAVNLKQQEADDRAGIYIAYATAPNRVADDAYERGANHSPFTKALLNNIATPGYSLKQAMSYVSNDVGDLTDWNQTPWTNSSLTNDLQLNGLMARREISSQSSLYAERSRLARDDGGRGAAIVLALKGLPGFWPRGETSSLFGSALVQLSRAHEKSELVLKGHRSSLLNAAFSPDGKLVATSAMDGTVKIWDAATAEILDTFVFKHTAGYMNEINSVAFSPDGSRIVTSQRHVGGVAHIWDIETGEVVTRASAGSALFDAEFSPDGNHFVGASADKTVRIWDAKTGVERQRFAGHAGMVYSATFHPDGTRVASASEDGSAVVWDVESGDPIHVLKVEGETRILDAAFNSTGTVIVTITSASIRLWDAATGEQLPMLSTAPLQIEIQGKTGLQSVRFSPDDSQIITAHTSGEIRIWDVQTGEDRHLQLHDKVAKSAAFSPNGKWVLTASYDRTAKIVPIVPTTRPDLTLKHDRGVTAVAFSANGDQIVAGGTNEPLIVWNAKSGTEIVRLIGQMGTVVDVAMSPDGQKVAAVGAANPGRVWNTSTGEQLYTFPKAVNVPVNQDETIVLPLERAEGKFVELPVAGSEDAKIGFSPDGRLVYLSELIGTWLWDAYSGDYKHFFRGIEAAAFGPDNQLIIANDGFALRFFNMSSMKEDKMFELPEDVVRSVSIGRDGTRVLVSIGRGAQLWDTKTGTMIRSLDGHESLVNSAVFMADQRRVVTAANDQTVRIWDAFTGQELKRFNFKNLVNLAAIDPKGNRFVAASNSPDLEVWDAGLYGPELLEAAYALLTPELRAEVDRERIRYWEVDPTALQ